MAHGGCFLELVRIAKMRGRHVLFSSPDSVFAVDGEEKSHGPGAVPVSALVVDLNGAVVSAGIPEIVDHVPQSDTTDDGEILKVMEALGLVKIIDDVAAGAILLGAFEFHGDLHVPGEAVGVANALIIKSRRTHHHLLDKTKHHPNLHEVLGSVKIIQGESEILILVGDFEAIIVKIITLTVLAIQCAVQNH